MGKVIRFWNSKRAAPRAPVDPNKASLKFIEQMVSVLPEVADPQALAVGKTLVVKNDEGKEVEVVVQHVLGNIANPMCAEINGEFTLSFLDFYTQLLENRRPTEEELKIFNEISIDGVLKHDSKETPNE